MNENEKFKILLIEDNDDHAEIIEFYFDEICDSIQIKRLSDGEEVIGFIRNFLSDSDFIPRLILLDLKLPKYDGHEILRKMKEHKTLKVIPVIILTTSNSRKDVETALENHANSYIIKPIEQGKFKDVIKSIIEYWNLNEHIL